MLKHLKDFQHFDFNSFIKDKVLVTTSCTEWLDYDTKQKLGTKVEVVIYQDNTAYKQKNGEITTNLFEKLVLKVKKNVQIQPKTRVVPIGAVAKIYGEYSNNLSITCDDVQPVAQTKP